MQVPRFSIDTGSTLHQITCYRVRASDSYDYNYTTAMTLESDTFEARLNAHAQRLLKTHETLLRDRVRNGAFYKALEKNIKPGDAVLDIGAGTGVWAIAAAKLGARRVVSIDADELMIGAIKILAAEHGVASKVEAIWGNSLDVSLAREFDVVVSETIGYLGYDENIVAVMHDARTRFLKPGGCIIPETISLYAAAGHLKVRQNKVPEGVPFEFSELARLNLNSPRVLKRSSDIKLLTKSVRLIETDLKQAETRPSLEGLSAVWDLDATADVNCIALWVESRLTRGVRLSTRRTTSWQPTIFRVEPPENGCEGLEFNLSLTPENTAWNTTFTGGGERVERSYSLAAAAETMVAAARDSDEKRDISGREATADDREFLYRVYASSRADEVAMFGWDDAQSEVFLRSQFDIRERAYAMQSPDASNRVIMFAGENAGSMIVNRGSTTVTLVDIAVLPEYRRRGIASHFLRELQAHARDENRTVVLHVEKINANAFNLYRKHDFAVSAENDLYYEMTWTPT